jgi:hypothetical protein
MREITITRKEGGDSTGSSEFLRANRRYVLRSAHTNTVCENNQRKWTAEFCSNITCYSMKHIPQLDGSGQLSPNPNNTTQRRSEVGTAHFNAVRPARAPGLVQWEKAGQSRWGGALQRPSARWLEDAVACG